METNNQNLLRQLFQLEWLLRRSHMQNHRDRGPMASPYRGQGRILALLKLKPEISQKELANILDIRSQSLGELLGKLERSGFITRTPSEADRRVMDIYLTEAGKTAATEQADEPREMESFFDCLNEQEQTNFSDYLERLIKSLEKQLEANGAEPGLGFGPDFRRHGGHPFRRSDGTPPDFEGFEHFPNRGHRGGFGFRNPFDNKE